MLTLEASVWPLIAIQFNFKFKFNSISISISNSNKQISNKNQTIQAGKTPTLEASKIAARAATSSS